MKGWETKTLGDVLAVLRNGVNCKQDKSGNGDRVSRIESISDASFNLDKVGYAKLSERDKERHLLQSGDILFSHINSAIHVGKTAVFDCSEPVYHGVNLLLMRPKEMVTPAYLERWLKFLFQSGYWRNVCKQSVNQASVNQQDISRVEISFPKSLSEQRRIVDILDEAFENIAAAKANAERNLRNARALFESHLQSVFSQRGERPFVSISEVAAVFDGPHATPKTVGAGPVFLGISALQDGKINLGETRHVKPEDFEKWTRRVKPRTDDVVFSYETRLGQAAIIPEGLECCLGRRMGLVRLNRIRIDPRFPR